VRATAIPRAVADGRVPRGKRPEWKTVPESVRQNIETQLGSRVIRAVNQAGGFSPGLAARVELANGERAFVKAIDAEAYPLSATHYRHEITGAAQLPMRDDIANYRFGFERDGWIALGVDDVDGFSPTAPVSRELAFKVLQASSSLSTELSPSPLEGLPTMRQQLSRIFRGWRTLAGEETTNVTLLPWARRNLDRLAEAESKWEYYAEGNSLVHGDLRFDNVVIERGTNNVVFVDWAFAGTGPAWFDAVNRLGSLMMNTGLKGDELIAMHPAARAAKPEALNAVVIAVAGCFAANVGTPSPPGLPAVRQFQTEQLKALVPWLAQRTGWR
jgi:hypothetical protein